MDHRVQKELDRLIREKGSKNQAAIALGIGRQFLHDILRGRRNIPDEVLDKLGFEWQLVRKRR